MDDYEKKCKEIRENNAILLDEFEASLKRSGLTQKTIQKHSGNVNFFINEFLPYQDEPPLKAEDGIDEISVFLGYWFIRKATWSSEANIKENAASFKKFYSFMFEKKKIDKKQLAELKSIIKHNMPDWLETMQEYEKKLNEGW